MNMTTDNKLIEMLNDNYGITISKEEISSNNEYIKLDKEFLFDESINEETIRQLAELTNGYSGADIKALYREAAMKSIREQLEIDSKTGKLNVKLSPDEIKIKIEHFLKTIEENDTVGIIICKKDNKYVIEYCSDDRIIAREYELV